MSGPTPPVPAGPAATAPGEGRRRAWLWLAVAVLMVLVYLSAQLTYAKTHLPPPRYHRLAPGAVAHGTWADFRLVSLQQTDGWGTDLDGRPGPAAAGAVWVVARLEVVPRHQQRYMLCTLLLAATDGRSWQSADSDATHEGDGCVPDDVPVELGRTYPIVVGYQVPAAEADHLAGLALDPYSWRRYQLLRPPV